MRLIDADTQYERACNLEAQALDYVEKLIERDGDEVSAEWKIWSAILTERTAFKHDIFDAPTIDAVEVVRCKECKHWKKATDFPGKLCAMQEAIMKADDYCSYGEREGE